MANNPVLPDTHYINMYQDRRLVFSHAFKSEELARQYRERLKTDAMLLETTAGRNKDTVRIVIEKPVGWNVSGEHFVSYEKAVSRYEELQQECIKAKRFADACNVRIQGVFNEASTLETI